MYLYLKSWHGIFSCNEVEVELECQRFVCTNELAMDSSWLCSVISSLFLKESCVYLEKIAGVHYRVVRQLFFLKRQYFAHLTHKCLLT